MIVAKFGGTSVGNADAINRLIAIVRSRQTESPVIVVSALDGVTDQLLQLAHSCASNNLPQIDADCDRIVERHVAVMDALGIDGAIRERTLSSIGGLRTLLQPLQGRSPTPEELDLIAGFGELWSSELIAAACANAGLPATWVDIRLVVHTDSRFTRARPDRERMASNAASIITPLVQDGRIPITQGFLGSDPMGCPTTLGRGGSDYTATLLGAALHATRVEIWTDVDGLMTADPRIVPTARRLAVATYDEAAELATFGAKVLHPATQLPLAEEGIPIVILNSRRPDGPGTTITGSSTPTDQTVGPIRSISWKPGITVITVQAPRMLGTFGFLRRLFQVFEELEVVVDVLASSEVSVSLTIEDASRLDDLRPALTALGQVEIMTQRAIIAVVGTGLRTTPGIAAQIFGAIQGTNVEVISQGSSAINVTFVVREEEAVSVVSQLHHTFFGEH